jgi:hypothetical protein
MMTNNDEHNSYPRSTLSVIGVWQYLKWFKWVEHLFFSFSKVILYVLFPIQKQRNYFKHSELSALNVLDLALYSKQLNNCHSSIIIQTKYNISMNQLFTVFVKDANISQIILYYQIFIA